MSQRSIDVCMKEQVEKHRLQIVAADDRHGQGDGMML